VSKQKKIKILKSSASEIKENENWLFRRNFFLIEKFFYIKAGILG